MVKYGGEASAGGGSYHSGWSRNFGWGMNQWDDVDGYGSRGRERCERRGKRGKSGSASKTKGGSGVGRSKRDEGRNKKALIGLMMGNISLVSV